LRVHFDLADVGPLAHLLENLLEDNRRFAALLVDADAFAPRHAALVVAGDWILSARSAVVDASTLILALAHCARPVQARPRAALRALRSRLRPRAGQAARVLLWLPLPPRCP